MCLEAQTIESLRPNSLLDNGGGAHAAVFVCLSPGSSAFDGRASTYRTTSLSTF
jgi:hypothetical protein